MAGKGTDDPTESPAVPVPFPAKRELDACRRCALWEHATQGVPGEGPRSAPLLLVGEQPGDEEDLTGRPFVGPAGRLLRELLNEAGIDAAGAYITNAVKHFSWEPRGKRRLHKTPAQREFDACNAWLEKEIASVRPKVIVALGAKALVAVLGRRMTIAEGRESKLERSDVTRVLATFHPSAVLRAPDSDRRAELRQIVRDDLAAAAKLVRKGK